MSLTEDEARYLRKRGYENPAFFCTFYLEHWFPCKGDTAEEKAANMPWLHKGILAILRNKAAWLAEYPADLEKIVSNFVVERNGSLIHIFEVTPSGVVLNTNEHIGILIPRGYSKTTLCNASSVMDIVYEDEQFLVYLSESATHADTQLGNVKAEIEANSKIRAVFGDLKPDRSEGLKWTEGEITCRNGVHLVAKGRGAQVRGMNFRGQRPGKAVADDLEDEESVKSPEQIIKAKGWFYKAVLPALRRRSARVIVLGTLLHADALLPSLHHDPRFLLITFGAIDRQGDATWPEHKSLEDIQKEKLAAIAAGQLDAFLMETMSTIRNEQAAKFKSSYIQRTFALNEELVAKAVAVDPAISSKASADFFVVCAAGITSLGRIWAMESWGAKGVHPNAQVDKVFEFYGRHLPQYVGIEAIAYQTALVHLVQSEMFRRGVYFEVTPITHGNTRKTERVEGILQPRFAAGYVTIFGDQAELVNQLLDWPAGKKDFPDALAMAVALLDPYAALAANKNPEEDWYEPLEMERYRHAP